MEYNKENVYFDPENWMIGKKAYFSDSIASLKVIVTDEKSEWLGKITSFDTESSYPFVINNSDGRQFKFVYILEPEDKTPKTIYYVGWYSDEVSNELAWSKNKDNLKNIYFYSDDFDVATEWYENHKRFESLMRAHEEDHKDIQFYDSRTKKFIDVANPAWDFTKEYRIKPDKTCKAIIKLLEAASLIKEDENLDNLGQLYETIQDLAYVIDKINSRKEEE